VVVPTGTRIASVDVTANVASFTVPIMAVLDTVCEVLTVYVPVPPVPVTNAVIVVPSVTPVPVNNEPMYKAPLVATVIVSVVAAIAPESPSLLGLIDAIAPIITSGNTVVVLASTKAPLSAMTFAEVLATSDLPAGVINILTGKKDEIAPWMASHMDIDALDISGLSSKKHADIKVAGAENLKRIHSFKSADPGRIIAFMEAKTVWHPIGL